MDEAIVNQKELKKLSKSLKLFAVNVQRNIVNGSTRAAANVVKEEMKTRVPYEYGTLEDALQVKKQKSSKDKSIYSAGIKRVVVENGTKLKNTKQIAYYLEYGTQNMPQQSFIRPSLHAVGNRPLEAAKKYFFTRLPKEKAKQGFK